MTKILAAGGALAAMLVLGACAQPTGTGPTSTGGQGPHTTAGQPNTQQGTGARVKNQKLGASYVVPQGFAEATGTPDIPGVAVTTFVLGKPDPSKIVTQFMLTKLQGPDDYIQGTSPDMDNTALLDAFVKEAGSGPGDTVEGEPERSEWQGELPGASALVKTKTEGTGETGDYKAFVGSGEHRWAVRGMLTTFPPGTSLESLKAQLDEFAKSIRPL